MDIRGLGMESLPWWSGKSHSAASAPRVARPSAAGTQASPTADAGPILVMGRTGSPALFLSPRPVQLPVSGTNIATYKESGEVTVGRRLAVERWSNLKQMRSCRPSAKPRVR